MPDYRRRVKNSQGQFRQLMARLPGFKGYIEKEARREADKMLRDDIARKLDVQRSGLEKLSARYAQESNFAAVSALERVRMRLQTVTDKIKTGAYGYAGFFDAATVNEAELDALYEFDNGLLQQVDKLAAGLQALPDQLTEQKDPATALTAVSAAIDELSTTWMKRQDVITGHAV